jgi:sodium/hydrogen antiporter
MSASDLAIVAAVVFLWGTLSARLERYDVTAPIIFVLAGLLLTHGPLTPLGYAPSPELVKALAEITLVLVLFSDASRVRLRDLRAETGLCLRLLGVGLPLTIGLGVLLAFALFSGLGIWLALLVGAALAPTDAALGAGVMVNPAVPARIRRLLNIESGLNDGIVTPVVLVAIAGAATAEHEASVGPGAAVAELALGVLLGVLVGGAGGFVVNVARRRGWAGGVSLVLRCWPWRSARTHVPWRCTEMASSPRSWAAWPTAPPAGKAVSGWCLTSRRPVRWCRCWSGWRSAPSRSCRHLTT